MAENSKTSGTKYSPSEFKIVKATMDHFEQYRDFVGKHFSTREQLSVGLHVPLEESLDYISSQMEKWLTFGTSVAAIHTPTNRLAGISLTTILTRDNKITFNMEDVKKYGKEIQNLVRVAGDMEKQVNLFADSKIDKILEIALTTADPEFSGNKITYRMTEEIERLAKEQGCQMATSQSTNKITQHIRAKMGYEEILRIDYTDLEIDGEKVMDLSVLNGSVCAVVLKKYL